MIDNIKFYISGKDSFESFILNDGTVELKASKSFLTNEVQDYPKRGKLGNLEVVINQKRAYIKGSIHKLENLIDEDGSQNYDDFSFCQMNTIIDEIISYFNVSGRTSISQLEIGLNMHIPMNPQRFLKNHLLMCDFRDHNKDLPFRGKGDYKEFMRTDYHLKVYNKSKQYHVNAHILRVELKILSKRKLREFGIENLEDLQNKTAIERLFKFLMEEVKKCTIIDDYNAVMMPIEDREKFYRYTNPNYWIILKDTKSLKIQSRHKKDFQALCAKYHLTTIKNVLMKKMIEKFWHLLKCTSPQGSEYVNAA